MSKTLVSLQHEYKVPNYIVVRHDKDVCIAINLNTLKQYELKAEAGQILYRLSQMESSSEIVNNLVKKEPKHEKEIRSEYQNVLSFLSDKGLIEISKKKSTK